eukprot:TRINITY_DN731_c0_g1_i1.p1 TRINITY_DN731_c0_g1~~TRINITY_DN731_c0_g1_i1.p1  ORF type:complete len:436 (+),score=64.06 TRINITY_DN731_c0_g1_i1:1156-2463(+)
MAAQAQNLPRMTQKPAADIVRLNVGGVHYMTTRSTLTKYRESMLGALFSGDFAETTDEEGRVFIDRDGELFGFLLSFLRTGSWKLPAGQPFLESRVHGEAEYFGLPWPEPELDLSSVHVVAMYEDATELETATVFNRQLVTMHNALDGAGHVISNLRVITANGDLQAQLCVFQAEVVLCQLMAVDDTLFFCGLRRDLDKWAMCRFDAKYKMAPIDWPFGDLAVDELAAWNGWLVAGCYPTTPLPGRRLPEDRRLIKIFDPDHARIVGELPLGRSGRSSFLVWSDVLVVAEESSGLRVYNTDMTVVRTLRDGYNVLRPLGVFSGSLVVCGMADGPGSGCHLLMLSSDGELTDVPIADSALASVAWNGSIVVLHRKYNLTFYDQFGTVRKRIEPQNGSYESKLLLVDDRVARVDMAEVDGHEKTTVTFYSAAWKGCA